MHRLSKGPDTKTLNLSFDRPPTEKPKLKPEILPYLPPVRADAFEHGLEIEDVKAYLKAKRAYLIKHKIQTEEMPPDPNEVCPLTYFSCDLWPVEETLLRDLVQVRGIKPEKTRYVRGLIRAASWRTYPHREATHEELLRCANQTEREELNKLYRQEEHEEVIKRAVQIKDNIRRDRHSRNIASDKAEELAELEHDWDQVQSALRNYTAGQAVESAVVFIEDRLFSAWQELEQLKKNYILSWRALEKNALDFPHPNAGQLYRLLRKIEPAKAKEDASTILQAVRDIRYFRPIRDQLYAQNVYAHWFAAAKKQ